MAGANISTQETPVTPWWLVLIEGIALIIVGLLLLSQPGMTSVILVQVLGFYWLIMGVIRIASIFIDSAQWGWKLFAGILGIIAGIIVIRHPLWSTVLVADTFLIVLGLLGIVIGIASIVQAFRGAGWGTGILGAISIILGIGVLANIWKLSFSLPFTLGILALVGGIVAIFDAFRVRREERQLASAAPPGEPEAVATEPEEEAAQISALEEGQGRQEETGEAPVAVAAAAAVAAEEPAEEVEPEAEAGPEDLVESPADEQPPKPDHHAMQFIEGIGPAYAEKLAANGIESTESLLEQGATPSGRSHIAEATGISGKLILTWVNHADLMRIKGIGSQYADLLEAAGVDTVPELARRNPTNLYETIVAINDEKNLVRHVPSQAQVQDWVAMANELPRIIQY